ncbi:MAG: alpha/beta fold hydrolase [Halanaeroarchaeum sp.]
MASHESANAPLPSIESAASEERHVNGVDLHVVSAGDPDDPLVVLLHGFPEFWYGWREVIEPIVDAGYRVLVPDQRGYNRSEKPDDTRAYRQEALTRDVVELVASEGRNAAAIVGHDWGGLVGWDLALREPDVVDALGIVNIGHPTVFKRRIRTDLTQLRKSWYVFFFQVPWLPEWSARRNDFQLWADALVEGSNPNTFSETDLDRYRRAWKEPGAPSAMIDWYRAMIRHSDAPSRNRVDPPTLLLWGENDQALVPEMAQESIERCEDGRLERFDDATHWIVHEYPDRIAAHLIDHLDRSL